MAEEESLVSRRSKRSTAGNRMELALAELALEEPQDLEEDVDFVVEKEEEDVFESDFASTDEEATREDVDEGDRVMREEERRERKTTRARVERATAAAHARQRVTFGPGATSSQLKRKLASKPKRRVSLGVVVNAETGEVIEGGAGTRGVKRQSQRRHTIMNTSATVNRIKDAEEKRAAIPKKTKMATRLPTQDELIARALDTEEGNIKEHRDYLRLEEEKRAKARVVKQAIEGPALRWISKKESIQVEVQPPPPSATTMSANLHAAKYSFVYASSVGPGTVGSQAYSMPFYAYAPPTVQSAVSKPQEATASAPATVVPSHPSGTPEVSFSGPSTTPTSLMSQPAPPLSSTLSSNIPDPVAPTAHVVPSVPSAQSHQQQPQPQPPTQPPSQTQIRPASSAQSLMQAQAQTQTQTPSPAQPTTQAQAQPQIQTSSSAQPNPSSVLFTYPPVPATPVISHRTEIVCKNYVVHELSQSVPSNPVWKDTMSAMFGDHVQWDELRVFTGKGRPLSRPVRTCPITGQPAKYRDPRTNVPFANAAAYDVLTKVLGRGYVWCSALGCYVAEGERNRRYSGPGGEAEGGGSVSAGMAEGVAGVKEDENVEGEVEWLEDRTTKRRKVGIPEG